MWESKLNNVSRKTVLSLPCYDVSIIRSSIVGSIINSRLQMNYLFSGSITINISFPRVGIEPTISRVYSHTLCLCAMTGLKFYYNLFIYFEPFVNNENINNTHPMKTPCLQESIQIWLGIPVNSEQRWSSVYTPGD